MFKKICTTYFFMKCTRLSRHNFHYRIKSKWYVFGHVRRKHNLVTLREATQRLNSEIFVVPSRIFLPPVSIYQKWLQLVFCVISGPISFWRKKDNWDRAHFAAFEIGSNQLFYSKLDILVRWNGKWNILYNR